MPIRPIIPKKNGWCLHPIRKYSASQPSSQFRGFMSRLGHMTNNGITRQTIAPVAHILRAVATDWKDLLVGVEGFLTSEENKGIFCQAIESTHMNSMEHVDNLQYLHWAESGRKNWTERLSSLDLDNKSFWNNFQKPEGTGLILKTIKSDFKLPLKFPDRIIVLHKVRPVNGPEATEFTLEAVILSQKHRRIAARLVKEIVVYDYRNEKRTSMGDIMFQQLKVLNHEQDTWAKLCQSKLEKININLSETEKKNGYI